MWRVEFVLPWSKEGRSSQAKMPSPSSTSTEPALILKKFGTNDAKGNLKSVLMCIYLPRKVGTFTFFKLQASTFLHVSAVRSYLFGLEWLKNDFFLCST